MAKSPKSRMSASCPAIMSSISATSTQTQLRGEVPAKSHSKNPRMVQRLLKKVREAFYRKEKVSHEHGKT